MSLSDPHVSYGIHSVAPYSRKDGSFFGISKVLADSTLAISGELVKLNGGSNKWPWAIEDGLLNGEVSLSMKEYPDFVFELFLGKKPTTNSAEASGNVSSLTNIKGTSAFDVAAGVDSVAAKAGSEADMKFMRIVGIVISATTMNFFGSTDLDFARGVDEIFEDDTLLLNAAPITIPALGATVDLDDFGLTFTGGSDASIVMVVGDSFDFEIRPINDLSRTLTIGATTDLRPEFGMIVYSALRSDGTMFEVDLIRVKGIGLPLGFAENAFAEPEITAEFFYDSAKNAVFKLREIKAPLC